MGVENQAEKGGYMISRDKHIGFFLTMEEFESLKKNLVIPWVAYVKAKDGMKVLYSNDRVIRAPKDEYSAEQLIDKLEKLESNTVCCTESEMDDIITNHRPGDTVTVTDIEDENGKIKFVKKEVKYSSDIFFYTYEDDLVNNN